MRWLITGGVTVLNNKFVVIVFITAVYWILRLQSYVVFDGLILATHVEFKTTASAWIELLQRFVYYCP